MVLAGAVAKATIQIGARMAAITRFRQLSAAIATSDNRLVRFGRNALIASGQATILGAALNVVRNPLFGIATLLETGLATAQWLSFARGARSARVQLATLGITGDDATKRLGELQASLGLLGARDLFNAGRAFTDINKLSADWRDTILAMKPDIEAAGLDFEILGGAIARAASTGKIQDIEAMAAAFGDIETEGKTFAEVLETIVSALNEVEEADLTNIEETAQVLGDIQERASGIIGPVVDGLNVVPLLAAKATKGAIFFMLDTVTDFKDGIGTILSIVGDTYVTLMDVALLALEGKWEEIPERLTTLWNEKVWPELKENIKPLMTVAGTAIGGMLGGPLGAGLGAGLGSEIGGAIQKAVDGEYQALAPFIGGAIGYALLGPLGLAIGGGIGTIFEELNTDIEDRSNTKIVGAAALVGGSIGLIVAGPLGAAVGAGIGTGIGLMTVWVTLHEEELKAVGTRIGEIIRDAFLDVFGFGFMADWINQIKTAFGDTDYALPGVNVPGGLWNPARVITELFEGALEIIRGRGEIIEDFAHGGVVPGPVGQGRIIRAHGGETITPVGGRMGEQTIIHLYIGDKKVDTVVADSLGRTMRRNNVVGRRLGSA